MKLSVSGTPITEVVYALQDEPDDDDTEECAPTLRCPLRIDGKDEVQ